MRWGIDSPGVTECHAGVLRAPATSTLPGGTWRSARVSDAPASGIHSTTSASSLMRPHSRSETFAIKARGRTPVIRCVARIRCTPKDLPRCATSERVSAHFGDVWHNQATSSTTTSSRGHQMVSPSCATSETSCLAMMRSRFSISATNPAKARSLRAGSRSLTMPMVWGRANRGRNPAPPLKSTKTHTSALGEYRLARDTTISHTVTLFPLPVAPHTTVWGPSRTRSMTGLAGESCALKRPRSSSGSSRSGGGVCTALSFSRAQSTSAKLRVSGRTWRLGWPASVIVTRASPW